MEKTIFAAGEMPEPQQPGYGSVAMALHWLIVVLLLVQFVVAWSMPEIHRGVVPETLINLHMSFGVLILLVVIFRLVGRLQHSVPLLRDNVAPLQQMAAHVMHGLLYLMLLVVPVLGWASASARDWQVTVFGTVTCRSFFHLTPELVP